MKTMLRHSRQKGCFAIKIFTLIFISFLLNQCADNVHVLEKSSSDMVITEYIYSKPELFSEFGGIIKLTGVENLLRVRGPYTLLLPTDEAMKAYYTKMHVSSYMDLDIDFLTNLAYNHILKGAVNTTAIGLGALPYQNGLNDYVASDLQGTDIVLNKTAKIIKRDIEVSNGYVQHIDKVLDVVTKSVYDVLGDDGGYTIFKEGLDKAGFKDTLNLSSYEYGNIIAPINFTLLAVPDTLYEREGINSINDLIDKYATNGELNDTSNGFYKYMEYHCLSGVHYFSQFDQNNNFYLLTQNDYINVKVEKDFEINKTDSGYTGFYYEQSNIPAKNGVIHTINSQFPVTINPPVEIIFQVTDYPDLHLGAFYQKSYARFYDGQNTFKGIKWDGEYLMYYFKQEDSFWDGDGLSMTGNYWVEITTPKIRKGKYELYTYMFGGAPWTWYVDGEYLSTMTVYTWGAYDKVGNVEFTETKEHTIRVASVTSSGGIWWDRIRFKPL